MKTTDDSFLSMLLVNTSVDNFFEEYWQKKPLHISGDSNRFLNLFDKSSFYQGIRQCGHLKMSFRDTHGLPREQVCLPDTVDAAFRAGATICISDIQKNKKLDQFMASFAKEVHQAGELSFNCYYSPDHQGFSLHLDDHPVWILQIEGKKRWWFSKTPYHKPLSTVSFSDGASLAYVSWADPIKRPDESEFFEVMLEPGDVLYLPEGVWHRAAAEGESLALTLACSRTSPLDLVRDVIVPRIAHQRVLRENVPGAWASTVSDTIPPALEVLYAQAINELRAVVDGVTPQDMYDAWRKLASKQDNASPR